MAGNLDWKWIGIGVVVMLVLNLVAGLVLGLFLGPEMPEAVSPEDIELSGGIGGYGMPRDQTIARTYSASRT